MPITGNATFAKYPYVDDINNLNADIAVLGIPYDTGVGFLSGTRLSPEE